MSIGFGCTFGTSVGLVGGRLIAIGDSGSGWASAIGSHGGVLH